MKHLALVCLLAMSCCLAVAEESIPSALVVADDTAKFWQDVQPLLGAKCISCHGPEKQEGHLRLDSWAAAQAGGDRGAAIVSGDVEKSLLVQAISFRDPDFQMPPKSCPTKKSRRSRTGSKQEPHGPSRWPYCSRINRNSSRRSRAATAKAD